MTPEERAKAIIEHFAASLPPGIRPQLENVIVRPIHRAVNQELAKLERMAGVRRAERTAGAKAPRGTILPQSGFTPNGKRRSGI